MAKPPSVRKNFVRPTRKPQQARLWGSDTLLIERMSQEGRGVARRAGKIVFVAGALPTERVRVQCTAVKKDYDEADMTELAADTAPSVLRVRAQCPVYPQCGGCSLQHWSLAAQQEHKQARLLAMLQALAPGLALDPAINSPASGFRHRLRLLATRSADNHYSFGLRRRRSHEAVNFEHCPVANTAVNALLQALPGLLLAAPELQGLREVEIDADTDNRLGLCFYFAAHPGDRVLTALCSAVLKGPVSALRVRLNTGAKARAAGSQEPDEDDPAKWQEILAAGELGLELRLPTAQGQTAERALRLAYLPGDFTQTHWEVNAALVARALEWLQPGGEECALDLFSGIGNFSLPLASRCKSVHALEGDGAMALRLADNARRNGLTNIRAQALELMAGAPAMTRADIAVIDPPRSGAKAVCEALARSNIQRLVYVSCHPATLLRDARILQACGLQLARAAAVDMFPHTGHSEAIALFQRRARSRS